MSVTPDRRIADMEGPGALPRRNGELVFEDAWEGRVFGLAIATYERGLFEWDEFRDRLIEEIAAADRRPFGRLRAGDHDSPYYERWLAAFERLLVDKDLVSREELATRFEEFESGRRDDVF